jgi:hypothetical protein
VRDRPLLFAALFAAALAQPTNEPSDHERGTPDDLRREPIECRKMLLMRLLYGLFVPDVA